MQKLTLNFFACLLTVALVGCGGGGPSDTPDTGEVSGTITIDGKPVAGLQVSFQPESGRPSMGTTDESGSYELLYTTDLKGAKVGKGFFSIVTPQDDEEGYSEEDEGEGYAESDDPIPAKYNAEAATNSDMQFDVKAGSNTFDLDIKTAE